MKVNFEVKIQIIHLFDSSNEVFMEKEYDFQLIDLKKYGLTPNSIDDVFFEGYLDLGEINRVKCKPIVFKVPYWGWNSCG